MLYIKTARLLSINI